MALLTLAQQQANKPISNNWANYVKITGGVTNFVQLEKEVEEKEFKTLLGIAFLQDIQNNPLTAANVVLLDGSSFVNSCNETIYFKGLRYILSYMVYAEMVMQSDISDTFTGFVKKNREESTSLTLAEKRQESNRYKEIAIQEFEIIKEFLNLQSNETVYPYWKRAKSNKPYTPKIFGLKRTIL